MMKLSTVLMVEELGGVSLLTRVLENKTLKHQNSEVIAINA